MAIHTSIDISLRRRRMWQIGPVRLPCYATAAYILTKHVYSWPLKLMRALD